MCLRAPQTDEHLSDNDVTPDLRLTSPSIYFLVVARAMIAGKLKKNQRRNNGRFLYVLWNACKERNRRMEVALLTSRWRTSLGNTCFNAKRAFPGSAGLDLSFFSSSLG
jgi:hypothetical protein